MLLGFRDGTELHPGITDLAKGLGNGLLGLLQGIVHIIVARLAELVDAILGLRDQLLAALLSLLVNGLLGGQLLGLLLGLA